VALEADKTPLADAQAIRIQGESRIPGMPGRVRTVHLEPNDPPAYPGSIKAILAADMIVLGPGSLYTSVLPNLLVPDLARAVRTSRAFKVQVCNIANQPGRPTATPPLRISKRSRSMWGVDWSRCCW